MRELSSPHLIELGNLSSSLNRGCSNKSLTIELAFQSCPFGALVDKQSSLLTLGGRLTLARRPAGKLQDLTCAEHEQRVAITRPLWRQVSLTIDTIVYYFTSLLLPDLHAAKSTSPLIIDGAFWGYFSNLTRWFLIEATIIFPSIAPHRSPLECAYKRNLPPPAAPAGGTLQVASERYTSCLPSCRTV